MSLSFNKGDYDKFMEMVNTSKELLNESILLRSVQEKVNSQLEGFKSAHLDKEALNLIIALGTPLVLLLIVSTIRIGISWRAVIAVALIIYLVVYNILMDTPLNQSLHVGKEVHSEDPKPLKYLEMKVNYLSTLTKIKRRHLELLRGYYILFFPFICFLVYEMLFNSPPFGNLLWGLFISFLFGGIFWYFYFRSEILKTDYNQNQLKGYRDLIEEQNK